MIKRVLYLLLFSLCAGGLGLVSCDENAFTDPSMKGRIENVSFAKDTFYFSEKDGKVQIPLVASRYLNYAANLKIEVVPMDLPDSVKAVEKEHFFIDLKQVKIPLGESKANLNVRLVNDTLINPNRIFMLEIASAEGGGVVPPGKERSVVIIRNDDFIPEASIVFDSAVCHVPEECGMINIPFHLTKAAKGEVKVVFAPKQGNYTAKEREHFNFVSPEVVLPAGETKGFVTLEIINNLDVFDTQFDMVVNRVEGAAIGADSICDIRIINDDLDRIISFNVAEMSGKEDEGAVSFSLKATGGSDPLKMITGQVVIDSVFGCSESDFTIQNPEFSTQGDNLITINLNIKDNSEFGEWGVRFTINNLENARLGVRHMILKVKDDERKLEFEEDEVEIKEPEEPGKDEVYKAKIKLLGGTLSQDVKVTLMADGDADPAQYEFSQLVTILAGTSELEIPVKIKKHSSKGTRILRIKATGSNYTKMVLAGDEEIRISILNTDKAVSFGAPEIMIPTSGTWRMPLQLSAFPSPVKIAFNVKTPSVRYAVDAISDVIIAAGDTSGYVKVIIKDNNPGGPATDRVVIQIREVTVGGVVREDVLDDYSRTCSIGTKMDLNVLVGSWGGTQQRTYTSTVYTYGSGGSVSEAIATVISETELQLTGIVSTVSKSGGAALIREHPWRIKWNAARERFEFFGSNGAWEKDFIISCGTCNKFPCTCADPGYFTLMTTSDNKLNLKHAMVGKYGIDIKWKDQTSGVQTIKAMNMTSKFTYNLIDR